MRKLRVGLEARLLSGRLTGVGNYTFRTLQAIAATDEDIEFVGFGLHSWSVLDRASLRDVEGNTEAEGPRLARSKATFAKALAGKTRSKFARLGWAQSFYRNRFSGTVRRQSLDLFHAFNYLPVADPGVATLPVVYDLSFVRYPQFHPADRLRLLEKLPAILERAPRVQTISRFSKSEIADVYGYDEERIFIAPPAAAGIFRPLGVRSTAIGIDQYGVLPGRFLLSVGTLEPRKNLRTLILAYSKIPKPVRDRTPLVVVGGKGWGELDLPPCTNSMQEEGNLRFFGSVSNPQLRHLYEGAIALLYPSVYEGFGMPVVEAMACGTMVIHSKRTAMDEITEGLAVTVEAMDVESWSQAIKDIIEHSALAGEECSERLVARAAQFNWASSAALIRQNYHAAIA